LFDLVIFSSMSTIAVMESVKIDGINMDFLIKLFDVISACPKEIGGWNDKGDAFYIAFASFETYFSKSFHSDEEPLFSCFIQQLAFYDFRQFKVKRFVLFKHPLFHRDKRDWVLNIWPRKKSTDQDDKVEVKPRKLARLNPVAALDDLSDNFTALGESVDIVERALSAEISQKVVKDLHSRLHTLTRQLLPLPKALLAIMVQTSRSNDDISVALVNDNKMNLP